MIDLTNKKVDIDKLVAKYKDALDSWKYPYDYAQISYVFDVSIEYVEKKYNERDKDWKGWAIYIIKQLYEEDKINSKKDAEHYIDRFYKYFNDEFDKYKENIVLYSDKFNLEVVFVKDFFNYIKRIENE